MSQSRMRKASNAGEVSRVRSTFVKASCDTSLNPNRQQPRSRSKNNKIPKNIRYDLDNALVGLCDVWFEDIKPHLIRNNIKVHIHGHGPCPASGDHRRVPPGAPGCSHLDPGAASDHHQHQCVNSADCSLTPPTASKARYRKPPAAPPGPASPLQIILQSVNAQPQYKDINAPFIKKSNRLPYQRHSGLAQTYVAIPTDMPKNRTSNRRPYTAPFCRKKDKGSQTHFRYFHNPAMMEEKWTQTLRPVRRQNSARVSTNVNVPVASFDRCPGKTTLVPRPALRPKSCTEPKSLLSNLTRNEEKRKLVEVLYCSPDSSFNSSVTLLSFKGKRKRKGNRKIPPWR